MTVLVPITGNGATASAATVDLHLVGPLRVTARDGRDLTPSSAKAQGLLALLAVSPGMRRPRSWLQDKLWSDSPPEQGASNLRQTFLRLRHALGAEAACLVAGRGWIGLDPRQVRVLAEPTERDFAGDEMPELCEGLDIADPEFEDWIRDQRMAFLDRVEEALARAAVRRRAGAVESLAAPAEAARPCLLLAACAADSVALEGIARILTSDIATLVASFGAAEVLAEQPGLPPPAPALRLRVRAATMPDGAMFRAELEDPKRGALLRSTGRALHLSRDNPVRSDAYDRFVSETANVLVFELGRCRPGTGKPGELLALGYRAIEHAAKFTGAAFLEGDRLLAEACEVYPAPAYLAWRAHIRVAAIFERYTADAQETLDEATELVERAWQADPYNALVLAIKSDVLALHKGRELDALNFAERATETDPSNVYARIALAYRLAWTGNTRRAHFEALRALRLASRLPNPALWAMICCMTATCSGRYAEAIRFGTEAHRLAPEFKAPLRYLAALHHKMGAPEAATRSLRALRALEPDFSLDLMRSDDYPAWTLKRLQLLGVADSKLL